MRGVSVFICEPSTAINTVSGGEKRGNKITMKLHLQLQEITLYAALLVVIYFCLTAIHAKKSKGKGKMPPEAAGSWPVIGHLHLLGGGNKLLHKVLAGMADRHGPIFTVRLGTHQAVVVSNWEVAKECFTTNDKVFPQRPKSLAVKIMGYDGATPGLAPYGKYWRDMRKMAVIHLLSNHRLELLKYVRSAEINFFIKKLYEQSVKNGRHVIVQITEMFGDMAMNIIVRMLAGKQFSYDGENGGEKSRPIREALGDFFYLFGLFLASDFVPFLGWLDFVNGHVGAMKRTAKKLDHTFSEWLNEHRERRFRRTTEEEEMDFIDVMLSIFEDGNIPADDPDTVIKATCLSLILGGNDTTVITLTWTLSLLLNNRSVLGKAQDELDSHIGKDRQVDESDIKNLAYLQAIVKESLRLYPAAPLSVPREAMEDCTLAGFYIPARTRLFINLWKLHRDPQVWSNPLEFRPERFLEENRDWDVRGLKFEYMPFGSGRRMCPGVSFALQIVHLTLARLLHAFELGTISNIPVDMSETPGLTVPKATPLEVVLSPRIPSMVYDC